MLPTGSTWSRRIGSRRAVRQLLSGAIILALGTLVACSSSPPSSSTGPSGSPINVGFIAPLTGPLAGLGSIYQDGMKAGIQYVNAHGGALGRPLNLVAVDSAGNPTQAAALTRQLLGQGVVAIVGDVTSGPVLAEMAVVNNSSNPVPVMAGGSSDAIFNVGASPWSFGVQYVASLITQSYIQYFVKVRNFTQIGILHGNDAFATSANTAAIAGLSAVNLTAVDNEGVVSGSTDVTVQLRKLQNAGAQALLLLTFGNDSLTALKGLSAIGWHPPTAASVDVGFAATRTAVGLPALANVYAGPVARTFLGSDPSSQPTGITADYLKLYTQLRSGQLGGDQLTGAVAFDGAVVLAQAINKANSLEAIKIRRALESGQIFHGALGDFQFSANSHIGLPYSSYGLYKADVVCTSICVAAPAS